MSIKTELATLATFSRSIGTDPTLVQGAGGNASLKHDGLLWVKASGKQLAAAMDEKMFVALSLNGVLQRLGAGETDPAGPEIVGHKNAVSGLRPSIETTLHALLPHRIVAHAHCVNTISWAVRENGEKEIARLLDGLQWAWVPYRRPGLPLTGAVRDVMKSQPDVLVLANHGVVVGAQDCEGALALMQEVRKRLQTAPKVARAWDMASFEPELGSPYRLPTESLCHDLATNPHNVELVRGGTLYPDHIVFLGSISTVVPLADLKDFEVSGSHVPWLLVPGMGVLVARDIRRGGEEMLACLSRVLNLIPEGSKIRYLTAAEVAEIDLWDAEKYRQKVNS